MVLAQRLDVGDRQVDRSRHVGEQIPHDQACLLPDLAEQLVELLQLRGVAYGGLPDLHHRGHRLEGEECACWALGLSLSHDLLQTYELS